MLSSLHQFRNALRLNTTSVIIAMLLNTNIQTQKQMKNMYAQPTINKFYEEPFNHSKSTHENHFIHHVMDNNKKKKQNGTV